MVVNSRSHRFVVDYFKDITAVKDDYHNHSDCHG